MAAEVSLPRLYFLRLGYLVSDTGGIRVYRMNGGSDLVG
jgi:hypothetical protein